MEFEIGKPDHGWVRVRIETNGEQIEFEASDVPNDPVACLIEAIRSVAGGREADVWWHLEPDGYYFEFEPIAGAIRLRVLYAPSSDRTKAEVRAMVQGNNSEILLPLWRGLRKFEGYGLGAPHWPTLEHGSVGALRSVIGEHDARG